MCLLCWEGRRGWGWGWEEGRRNQEKKKDRMEKWIWILHTFLAVKIIPPLKKNQNKQKVHSLTRESTFSSTVRVYFTHTNDFGVNELLHSHLNITHSYTWLYQEKKRKGRMMSLFLVLGVSSKTLERKRRYLKSYSFQLLEGHVNDGNYDKYCEKDEGRKIELHPSLALPLNSNRANG